MKCHRCGDDASILMQRDDFTGVYVITALCEDCMRSMSQQAEAKIKVKVKGVDVHQY